MILFFVVGNYNLENICNTYQEWTSCMYLAYILFSSHVSSTIYFISIIIALVIVIMAH
jgi:hypothetical protein